MNHYIILKFIFCVSFLATLLIDSKSLTATAVLLFLASIIIHFIEKRKYQKLLKSEKIDFVLTGESMKNKSKLYSIAGFLVIVAVGFFVFALRKQHFNDTDFILLISFSIWQVYSDGFDSDMHDNYKFTEACILCPGLNIEKIYWKDIQSFQSLDKPSKFSLTLRNSKTIKFNIDKSAPLSTVEIHNYIQTRLII